MSIAPHPIEPAAADALARDSELLSAVLHDVLVEQCGGRFADTVRRMHEAAAALRDGEAGADAALAGLVTGLPARGHRAVHPRLRARSSSSRTSPRSASACAAGATTTRPARASASRWWRRPSMLREAGARPRRRAAHAARRARPHRAPDRGDAPLRARPPAATSRALLDRLDDPRIGRSRRRALLVRAARGADDLVADRRGAPHPPDGRGRGPAQPVLLRGDAATTPCRRCSRSSSAASSVRAAGASCRSARGPARDMDGHPEVGAETLARTLHAAPPDRAAAAARAASTGSRSAFSHSSRCARRSPRRSRRRSSATPPSCRRRACCAARTASGSRCGPSSASSPTGSTNMLDPLGARARLRRPAGAARRPLARARAASAPRHVAHGSDPPAAVADRRVRLPPRRASTSASRPSVVREAVAALLPGYADADEDARRRAARARRSPTAGAGSSRDPGGEAGELLRVLDTVALARERLRPAAPCRRW